MSSWFFGLRQDVRLAILVKLEPVLQMPHELVRRSEPRVFDRRQKLLVAQPRKRQQSAAVPDPRLTASMQALQALHQKFDIANAAFRQLHIGAGRFGVAFLLQPQFFVHARARFRDAFDSAEIGGGPVDERLDEFEKLARGLGFASRNPRFDQHLQFPIASAGSVVLFRAFEGVANFAEAPIGTQP